MLTASDPALLAFLDAEAPGWAGTQTVPPTDVWVSGTTSTSVTLSWTPIPYGGDGGYYEVSYSDTQGGPYTVSGITADKYATGYSVDDLTEDRTYYFVVRTYTPAHDSQQNELWSEYSGEVPGTPTG